MAELKHTPGPWIVVNGWDENGIGKYFPSVVLYGDPNEDDYGRRRITINVSHDQKIPSLMANAKLIAAAPDLLQAAINALEYLDHARPDKSMREEYNHHSETYNAIFEAIKKATE